jgi:hypothetical protein
MLRSTLALAATLALVLAGTAVHAKLTTGSCLAQKRTAWGTMRKCQATENAKQLKGKPADLAKCQTTFQAKLAKLSAKATNAAIPCRYRDDNLGTVTDYDTGLQWEKKTAASCTGQVQCVDSIYDWSEAEAFPSQLNGLTDDGSTYTGPFGGFSCLGGFCDWRLPTLLELKGIVDLSVSGCGSGSPCIDPIFGPTAAFVYSSATTSASNPTAWNVDFGNGVVFAASKGFTWNVRAVRTGL